MMNLMHKRLNKKGFTLAELLIVVAIIAILVAIAVPIFTSSLREAQLRTNQANVRSVKSAGVTYILTHWSDEKMSAGAAEDKCWQVKANVAENGDITGLTVTVLALTAGQVDGKTAEPTVNGTKVNESGGVAPAYGVVLYLTDADLTETKAP